MAKLPGGEGSATQERDIQNQEKEELPVEIQRILDASEGKMARFRGGDLDITNCFFSEMDKMRKEGTDVDALFQDPRAKGGLKKL